MLKDEIIELNGSKPGSTSIILVGVHGNEICGIEALKIIFPSLSIEKGRVIFVYGNPRAMELSVRFVESNLNRMFKPDPLIPEIDKKTYEYKRAQFLKKYLDQADVLLDIHASSNPESKPFVICEPNGFHIAQYLPVDTVVTGFDEVEPGGTDYYMNMTGKVGVCLECGFLGNNSSIGIAQKGIISFLTARGHITGLAEHRLQDRINMYMLYITKTDSFALGKEFSDFEKVHQGQLIGYDGSEQVKSDKDSVILFAASKNTAGSEAFLLGE